jgi:acetyltransferase-like isoleucine patch superfamily enzyme
VTHPDNKAYRIGLGAVGADVQVWDKAQILGADQITVGDAVIIDDFVMLMSSPVTLHSFIHIASGAAIMGGGEFLMEDFTCLSGGVRVYTGNEDYTGGCMTNSAVPAPYRIPIRSFVRLRKHSIVAAGCVVLPGVEIGEGAVVGAMSLVRKDVEPWTINVGIPAKPIKERPRQRILQLEERLRADLYDGQGRYIPQAERTGAA